MKKSFDGFFSKGNKLLVRQENSWYHGGLNILINKVLPPKFKWNQANNFDETDR